MRLALTLEDAERGQTTRCPLEVLVMAAQRIGELVRAFFDMLCFSQPAASWRCDVLLGYANA